MPKYVNTAKNEFYDLTDPNAPKLLGNMSDYSKTLAEQNFQSYLDSIASQKIANEREWGGNKDTLTNSDWWKTFVSQERVGRLQQEQGNAYQSLLGQTEFREGLAPTAPAPESPYKAPTGFGGPPVQTASMPTGYNGVNTNPDFKAATTGKSAEVAIQMKDKQGNMINVYPSSIPDLIREGTLPNGTNGITLKDATLTSPTGEKKVVIVGSPEASNLLNNNWTLGNKVGGGTITPESFTGENKIDTSGIKVPNDFSSSGVAASAASTATETDKILAKEKADAEAKKNEVNDLIKSLTDQYGTAQSAEAMQATEEAKRNIDAKNAAVASANSALKAKLAEIDALDKSYQNANLTAEGETTILSVMQGKMNQNFREYSIRKNLLSSEASILQANVLGLQGELQAAQAAADKAVQLKYADQQFKLDSSIKILGLIQSQADTENAEYADALKQKLTIDNMVLQQKMDYEKMAYGNKLDLMAKYPDAGITINDTDAQAKAKLAGSKIYQDQIRPPVGTTNKDAQNLADRLAIQQDVERIRGKMEINGDTYLDTAKYQQIRERIAADSPELLGWFDNTYDPKVVLNPKDPTNPYAKSTATDLFNQF